MQEFAGSVECIASKLSLDFMYVEFKNHLIAAIQELEVAPFPTIWMLDWN